MFEVLTITRLRSSNFFIYKLLKDNKQGEPKLGLGQADLEYSRPVSILGWLLSRWSNGDHNPKVVGSNPTLVEVFLCPWVME